MTRVLALVRAQGTVIGRQHSPPRDGTVTGKPQIKTLEMLLRTLSDVGSIRQIKVTGLDAKNAIKLQRLLATGRDFLKPNREMELTILRFLKALFAQGVATQAQIDAAIEEAVVKVISLRLRTGGGDVKSSFRPLSADYAKWKRRRYPNAKGIGWATGELAHEFADGASVTIVRSR